MQSWQAPENARAHYQNLARRLLLTGQDRFAVAFTGATPGVGVTTVTRRLAVALAVDNGMETVLVDANFSATDATADESCRTGWTDVVTHGLPLDDALQPGPHANLRFLPLGRAALGPVSILAQAGFARCLGELRQRFRWVIFDTAPVLCAAESTLLAAKLDGVALVVRAADTREEEIRESLETLRRAEARLLGLILNRTARVRRRKRK